MANYKHFTTCVAVGSHVKMNQYVQAVIQGIVGGFIAGLLAAAAGLPWCLLIAFEITLIIGVLGYCHWWLEDRLICLGGDRTVIGLLVSTEPPFSTPDNTTFPGKLDDDFSINLLPSPNLPGLRTADQATVETSSPYGYLVKNQIASSGLPFTGQLATDQATGDQSAVLHAEFEGGGVYYTLLGFQIALGLAVTALIICLGVPGPIGALIAAILAVLAFLAGLFGAGAGLRDTGSSGDGGPATLHTNDPATKRGADVLVVTGTWVYDSGHNNQGKGWNEIHPIKFAAKVHTWTGSWPDNMGKLEAQWPGAIADATSPQTIAQQQQPENQWQIHPLVDGCQPQHPPPPPPR